MWRFFCLVSRTWYIPNLSFFIMSAISTSLFSLHQLRSWETHTIWMSWCPVGTAFGGIPVQFTSVRNCRNIIFRVLMWQFIYALTKSSLAFSVYPPATLFESVRNSHCVVLHLSCSLQLFPQPCPVLRSLSSLTSQYFNDLLILASSSASSFAERPENIVSDLFFDFSHLLCVLPYFESVSPLIL